MAASSSLRLITSNLLLTRSVVVPTLASSSSRFPSIDAARRSYATTPTADDISNPSSWLNIMCPEISSLSFRVDMNEKKRSLKLKIPKQGLTVELEMPGLEKKNIKACGENNTLFIQGKPHKHFDFAGIKSPENICRDIKEGKNRTFTETTAKKDEIITNIIANEIISSFRDITEERGWGYFDMFNDQSILGKGLCPLIATLSSINSFTIYKQETDSTRISMSMPGLQEMKLTTQGLRVSLDMPGLDRKDVKLFFDYDTFFIEGKTKEKHFITGIHLPEGISKKNNLIKREMDEDGVFCAFLPCCVKKEDMPLIKDELKPKLNLKKWEKRNAIGSGY